MEIGIEHVGHGVKFKYRHSEQDQPGFPGDLQTDKLGNWEERDGIIQLVKGGIVILYARGSKLLIKTIMPSDILRLTNRIFSPFH